MIAETPVVLLMKSRLASNTQTHVLTNIWLSTGLYTCLGILGYVMSGLQLDCPIQSNDPISAILA